MTAGGVDHAGVRFPPPLLFGGVILAGRQLGHAYPLAWPGTAPGTLRVTAGIVVVAAGLALIAAAIAGCRGAGTSIVPVRPTTALVVPGPYRVSRNPMYLGLSVATAGAAVALGEGWVLVLLVPAVVVADGAFIRREERYLARTFGDAYAEYRHRVRRWL